MTFNDALAQEIRAELARRQISRTEFIRQMGRNATAPLPSLATMHRIIRGDTPWDVNTLDVAAKTLGVGVAELFRRAETVYRCKLSSLPLQRNPQVSACLDPS